MTEFLLAVLATFGLWETILGVVPWHLSPLSWLPDILKPALVFSVALVFTNNWHHAFAVMGAVAVMHTLIIGSQSVNVRQIKRKREHGLP